MNKKIIFFICLIAIVLSVASVSAAEDVDQTNAGDISNLDTTGGILGISSSENEILGANEVGTFTELQDMINNAGSDPVNLTKDYEWDSDFTSWAIIIDKPITINGNGHYIDAKDHYGLRIFEIQAPSGIVLNNMTLKGGNSDYVGGAIISIGPSDEDRSLSDSSFTNLKFIGNTALENGGAFYFYKATNILFENVTFENNYAPYNGGAIYILGESTSNTFKNVAFNDNTADMNGGAIFILDKSTSNTFNNVTFNNNIAEYNGGAIFLNSHSISDTFKDTIFENNRVNSLNSGAIDFNILEGATFDNVSFINNRAHTDGGAIFVAGETLFNTFETVEFINNTAENGDGGAIKFGSLSFDPLTEGNTFNNVIFCDNKAFANGGALYVSGPSNSNTFNTVLFENNVAQTEDGAAINFYNRVNDTTFNYAVFYNNGANRSGGAINFDYKLENSIFNNTLFMNNTAFIAGALGLNGPISSNTFENIVFMNNSADYNGGAINIGTWEYSFLTGNNFKMLIFYINGAENGGAIYAYGNASSNTFENVIVMNNTGNEAIYLNLSNPGIVIKDSIFINNDANTITNLNGSLELTDNWFGNNATNYDENPNVIDTLDNWLFLNATANPAALTLNETSTVTFKFYSYKNSGISEYDGSLSILLNISSTLGTVDETEARTGGDIKYTPSESGNGSVKGTFINKYYTITLENNKIPTEISVENTTIDMLVLDNIAAGANLTPADAGYLSYNSSNSSVAVAVYGRIIALAEGTAIITVSFDGDDTYAAAENKTIEVTVSKRPTEIILLNDTLNVTVLEFIPDVATLDPPEAGDLSYNSSNSSVVLIISDRLIPVGEGSAIITVSFAGNDVYAADNKTIPVNVRLNDASVSVDNDTLNLFVEDTYAINATTVPEFLKYYLTNYTSSDESIATVDENGTVTAVGEGTAIITVEVGDGIIFAISSTNVTVIVSKIDCNANVTNNDTALTVEVPEDATGNITLLIGDQTIVAPIENGTAIFDISDVPAGDYNATVIYGGDDKYAGFEIVYPISIEEDFILKAEDVIKYYNGTERFVANLTDGKGNPIANATVSIYINGKEYNRTTDDKGQASMAINLNSGEYPVVVTYQNTTVDAKVTVLATVNGTDVVKVFKNGTQYYATFRDSEGNYLKAGTTVTFNINGVFYERQVSGNKGLAKLNLNLEQGNYILTAMNPVTGENTANNITVISRLVENRDITKYYRNATQYTVKVIGDDGEPVDAGETVIFNIHGVFYERQTDVNGIAQLNINLEPGDYVITAEYKDCKVSNNIKVLPVLSAEDLTKMYGTPDPFVATLVDGQGNPYADQKVQFNINGVFYYRTTDSAGQAKLNINLMAGQYIITSSYNGVNIANTVTITPA